MKHYRDAAEVLDCLVDFHARAAELARQAAAKGDSEKSVLVFDFLYRHHLELQEEVADFAGGELAPVLATAVDYVLDDGDAPDAFVGGFDLNASPELEGAEKLVRALVEYIVGLLDNITSEIRSPDVAEVFALLLEMERSEQRKMFEAIEYIRDMP